MTTFADLRLSDAVLAALRDVGYESPSPIQEQAIPDLLAGRDVIGQAQTGTGKTAAFGLPMIDFVDPDDPDTQALILTPTRELCIQVTQALRTYGKHKGIDPVAVFGGAPIRTQQAQLKAGAQVVVGTVGRVLDLISRHSLVLNACRYMVLDEADEMLDLGFLEDVEKILSFTPNGRQTALFSATMPAEIRGLAERHLYDPVTIKVKSATLTIDTVEQFFVETKQADKNEMLARVLESERPDQAIVFVRTKIRCEQLYRTLRDRGMNVKALHGDMSQGVARRRDDLVQGRARADPGGDRRRRARAGHLHGHAHHQLRRPDLARRLRAPDRPHRPRRPLGARDHVRRAAPGARAGGDREERQHEDLALERRRQGRAGEGAGGAPAPPPQAARRRRGAGQRRRHFHEADRVRRPRRRARRSRT